MKPAAPGVVQPAAPLQTQDRALVHADSRRTGNGRVSSDAELQSQPGRSEPSHRGERIQSLEVVRAVAAWLVVAHHYQQLTHGFASDTLLRWIASEKGAFGVDLFFVLSGFVMQFVIAHGQPTASRFLKRRVQRIVPAYWFFTLCTAALLWAAPDLLTQSSWNVRSLAASLAFYPHPNPSGIGVYPVLTVGWTLNFEMFFYLLLAVLIWITRRATILVACCLLLLLPKLWPGEWPYGAIAGNWRMGEFALGLVLGAAFTVGRNVFTRLGAPGGAGLIVCGMAVILAASGRLAIAGSAGLIIAGALCLETGRGERSRLPPWLLHLGAISYSTYLSHTLVIALFLAVAGRPTTAWHDAAGIFAVMLLTWGVSACSYRFIERPAARL